MIENTEEHILVVRNMPKNPQHVLLAFKGAILLFEPTEETICYEANEAYYEIMGSMEIAW